MAILTESEIRDLIRQPQPGMTLTVPPGTRLSPAAQDFVQHWKLEVQVGAQAPAGAGALAGESAAWDRPAAFPVQLTGETPTCSVCGMPVSIKPDHMTQLDAVHYAPKNIPRIRFRGKLDTLQGLCLLIAARAQAQACPGLAGYLDVLAAYCREMMSAEYNERPVAPLAFADVGEDEIHKATHHPEEVFGISHLTPTSQDPELLHWLNVLRCESREVELVALDAFAAGPEYRVAQPALVKAVNRFSSAVYYLELRFMAGKL
jgi:ethanolamine utilization cobalamin adenosyltransferase